MTVRITWVDNNVDETGHRVYRSTSPMDPSALPEPIVTLAANVTTYDDTAAPADEDCYYRVAAERNGELAVSDEMMINTGTGGGGEPVETGQSFRYLRVNFTSRSTGSWVVVSEVDLSSGTQALTMNGLVYSTNSSGGAGTVAGAFDGSDSTYWAMNNVPPRHITVDFGSTVSADKIGIRTNGSSFDSTAYGPGGFDVLISDDGVNFTVVKTVTSEPAWAFLERREYSISAIAAPTPDLPTVIGEAFGGGFYAGDIEYPNGQMYKLIVADKVADITGSDSRWKTTNSATAGTDSLTDGVANTSSMIAAGIELHPAANHCINHTGGGNSDWYMPAKDELNVIYLNLGFNRPNCPADFLSGGPQAFASSYYWASTQSASATGWMQNFRDGFHGADLKSATAIRSRPIRRIAFTPEVVETVPTTIGEQIGGGYYIGDITVADGGADDGVYAVIMAGAESQATLAWKDPASTTPDADSTTNGLTNTLAMQAADPAIHLAGMYCLNHVGGGHDDWYLPAQLELNLTWVNRANLEELGMEGYYYWSSSQKSSYDAYPLYFVNGTWNTYGTEYEFYVRPVRRIKKS